MNNKLKEHYKNSSAKRQFWKIAQVGKLGIQLMRKPEFYFDVNLHAGLIHFLWFSIDW